MKRLHEVILFQLIQKISAYTVIKHAMQKKKQKKSHWNQKLFVSFILCWAQIKELGN